MKAESYRGPRSLAEAIERQDSAVVRSGKSGPMPVAARAAYLLGVRDALEILKASDPSTILAAVWRLEIELNGIYPAVIEELWKDVGDADRLNLLFGPPGDGASADGRGRRP